jgi:hypothetical protein
MEAQLNGMQGRDPDTGRRRCKSGKEAKPDESLRQKDPATVYALENSPPKGYRRCKVVSWVVPSSQKLSANKTEITRFREIIHRSMAICELNDVPEVYGVSYLPGAVIDPGQWIENSDATTMTINFQAEVQAGIV